MTNWKAMATLILILLAGAYATADDLSQPNAAVVYKAAADAIRVPSPADMAIKVPEFPAWSAEWQKAAAATWNGDGETCRLAHVARSINQAQWETDIQLVPAQTQRIRRLSAVLGAAALYQDWQGNDAQAIEEIDDLLHLSKLLLNSQGPWSGIQGLCGAGVQAIAVDRINLIACHVRLTNDLHNPRDLQISVARSFIRQLESDPNVVAQLGIGFANAVVPSVAQQHAQQAMDIGQRCDAERLCAAIILACHVYQFEKQSWPSTLNDLVPAYLPQIPIDPTGDGQ